MKSVHRTPWVAIVLSCLVAFSFALAIYSFYTAHQRNCDSRNVTLNVVATILLAAQHDTDTRPGVPTAQRLRSARFIQEQIKNIDQARC